MTVDHSKIHSPIRKMWPQINFSSCASHHSCTNRSDAVDLLMAVSLMPTQREGIVCCVSAHAVCISHAVRGCVCTAHAVCDRHISGRNITHLLSRQWNYSLYALTINNNNNNNNNNSNNNSIQKRYSRFFTISSQRRELFPIRMLKWPGRNRVQITCSTSSGYHVQVSCYVSLGTKGQLRY